MLSKSDIVLTSLLALFLINCDGDDDIAVNPINPNVISFEREKGTITSITIEQDTSLTGVRLVLAGDPGSTDFWSFTIISDNETLIPSENVQVTGEGKFREVSIKPASGQTGIANLTGEAFNLETDKIVEARLEVIVESVEVVEVVAVTELVKENWCRLDVPKLPCKLY